MAKSSSVLSMSFVPTNTDLALLLLRVWIGASMILLHGAGKVTNLMSDEPRFMSVLGLPPTLSLALAVLGEAIAPVFLIIGLGTRWAASLTAITMAMAFAVGHGFAFSGERSGELPFIFLAGFLVVLIAGPGKYSVDEGMGK
jgi:putative oxidoreductase